MLSNVLIICIHTQGRTTLFSGASRTSADNPSQVQAAASHLIAHVLDHLGKNLPPCYASDLHGEGGYVHVPSQITWRGGRYAFCTYEYFLVWLMFQRVIYYDMQVLAFIFHFIMHILYDLCSVWINIQKINNWVLIYQYIFHIVRNAQSTKIT